MGTVFQLQPCQTMCKSDRAYSKGGIDDDLQISSLSYSCNVCGHQGYACVHLAHLFPGWARNSCTDKIID